jgi:glycosyltransferase involved in cell wall biosynthesis
VRVLHVAESIKGGVGTYLNQIVPRQVEALGAGSVRVIVPRQHAVQIPDIDPDRVALFDRPGRSAGSLLALARCIVREVRAFRPDVIHAQSTFAGALVRMIYGLHPGGPRIVYCPHGWVFDVQSGGRALSRVGEIGERLLGRLADKIVAISEYEAREAVRIGIAPQRLRIVLNGTRAEAPAPAPVAWEDSRRKVLFVGRLDRQKGFDLLLAAIEGHEADFHVRAVGEKILSDGAPGQSDAPNVELLGWRTEAEIEALFRQADVVVMPSRWEGFGLVAIEAMRAGRPVFASRVGGLPEIVQDGVTGILFPAEDVARLRQALLSVPAERLAEMGRAGRRAFLDRFTIDRTHESLLSVYRELLGPRADQGVLLPSRAPAAGSSGR